MEKERKKRIGKCVKIKCSDTILLKTYRKINDNDLLIWFSFLDKPCFTNQYKVPNVKINQCLVCANRF